MLKVGDRVKMNGRYYVPARYRRKVFQVIAGPQEVGGQLCVWLEDFQGCYAVDGLDKVDSGLKFLDDRYAVICRHRGYAICTLKVAVPSEYDELGYVIDDARFEGLVFGDPEGAMVAINENPE